MFFAGDENRPCSSHPFFYIVCLSRLLFCAMSDVSVSVDSGRIEDTVHIKLAVEEKQMTEITACVKLCVEEQTDRGQEGVRRLRCVCGGGGGSGSTGVRVDGTGSVLEEMTK